MSGLSGPAWRTAHPWALWVLGLGSFGLGAVLSVLGAPVWFGLLPLAYLLGALGVEAAWHRRARRAGRYARWVVPSSRRWWARQGRRLGLPPLTGRLWEIHVDDTWRWPGTPREAAAAFREAYTLDMVWWINHRPPDVTLAGSTFNRLTPTEQRLITALGGTIVPGAIHPRLARIMTPRAYAALQQRLFGGVVSTTRRDDPARWCTWVLPPR